jgi:hypothetical protein
MEKRSYSRVAASISGRFRLMSGTDDQPLYSGWSGASAKDAEQALQQAKLPDAMVHFLATMDAKLDAILGQMQRDTLREDFPFRLRVSQISGAGIRFFTQEVLHKGSLLEVVLFLRQYPLSVASAAGRITRCSTHADALSDNAQNEYALEFTVINDSELEQVIGFVFDQERRIIRQHRWE